MDTTGNNWSRISGHTSSELGPSISFNCYLRRCFFSASPPNHIRGNKIYVINLLSVNYRPSLPADGAVNRCGGDCCQGRLYCQLTWSKRGVVLLISPPDFQCTVRSLSLSVALFVSLSCFAKFPSRCFRF